MGYVYENVLQLNERGMKEDMKMNRDSRTPVIYQIGAIHAKAPLPHASSSNRPLAVAAQSARA